MFRGIFGHTLVLARKEVANRVKPGFSSGLTIARAVVWMLCTLSVKSARANETWEILPILMLLSP
ncbi:hypothetical protein GCM10023116_05680 [Kistimonas scapharcae]|uniref:Uncharacterized protein n=1 Tax=Kistimonas scapharcae TaxID=1036133 RepID=A0ABP8UXN8_9GAMM